MARMAKLSAMPASQLTQALGGDPQEAARWVEAAAAHGVIAAQLALGRMLLEGHGVVMDKAAALRWFRRAAQGTDAEAMNMVGRCLELGWGCQPDAAAAAPWYRRSADAGHDWGEYNLAQRRPTGIAFRPRGAIFADNSTMQSNCCGKTT